MMNTNRYIKIAPNPSSILTDDEWRNYVLYYRNLETLDHYENNIKQHREMKSAITTHYEHELNNKKLLCDRIWHKEK